MAMQDTNFWRRFEDAVPGMIGVGAGLWGERGARKEAERNLAAADPRMLAQERFQAEQGLLAGRDVADEASLFRNLYNKGMLGSASFSPAGVDPVSGTAQSWQPGAAAVNPHMAAFYAAKNQRNAQMAADALKQGDTMAESQLRRQATVPSKATSRANLVRGALPILKETGVLKDIGGLFGRGADWLGRTTGLWNLDPYSGGQGTDFGEWYGW